MAADLLITFRHVGWLSRRPAADIRPVFGRLYRCCPDRLLLVFARRLIIVWRCIEASQIRIILSMNEAAPNNDCSDQQAPQHQQPKALGNPVS